MANSLLSDGATAVAVVDDAGTIVLANASLHETFGYPEGSLRGLSIDTLVPRDQSGLHSQHRLRYLHAPHRRPMGEVGELCGMRADGTQFPVEVDLLPVAWRGEQLVVASVLDVTLRQAARNRLGLAEERLRAAQRVARVGFWEWDIESDALYWSEEIFSIFGVPRKDFQPTYPAFLERVHPDDRPTVEAAVAAALASERSYSLDHRLVRPDGQVRHVHEQAEVDRDGQGRPRRMIGTVLDITERRELEEQLRHSQRLEAFGRLAGGIAHDFNNLLAIMMHNTQLALEDGSSRVDDELGTVLDACERGQRLVKQLLTFARRDVIRPRPTRIDRIAVQVERLVLRVLPERISLRVQPARGLWSTHVDPTQIEQVLLNLIVNARDAIDGHGQITVSTANLSHTPKKGAGDRLPLPGGDYVCLSVHDTGVGMDEGVRRHIFEPFFTTKPQGQGSGLGLSTCHGIATRMGGTIEVRSEPGGGSTFHVYLPRCVRDVGTAPAQRERQRAAAGRARLLLVEDEQALRHALARQLRRAGYQVLEASDGEDAEEMVADGARVDLLLTDLTMPGMGGVELARSLRARRTGLRVLFMSGYNAGVSEAEGWDPSKLLLKPFSNAELLERIRATLDADAPGESEP